MLNRIDWLQRYGSDDRATFASFAGTVAPHLVDRLALSADAEREGRLSVMVERSARMALDLSAEELS